MGKEPQIAELQEIYHKMDWEGRKKMVSAASELLNVQKTLEGMELMSNSDTQIPAEKGTVEIKPKTRVLVRCLVIGLLLLFTAIVFWVTLINPALLMLGSTPLVMLRIIITAICGMVCIGSGLVWFMLRKFTVLSMFLAIGAGVLCAEPGVITDLIGISIVILIFTVQIILWKRGKIRLAV
ncbi:MAG: hypothetical protein FWG99_00550 [Treponema sp.]|nr:hypothetical protein [Treponema sp.]